MYKSTAMSAFCASKGIQQRFSAPYAQWMDHTAECNMRTIGEMAVTTLVHANLPKSAWGHAVMHAVDVINRTADSADINKAAGFPNNYSRLEKWKGKELPGQTKGLYPFGCLAFKHVPPAIRTKLDHHATPAVYLGFDPKSRSFLLGSLFEMELSTSVDVTFMENVFPFRKIKHRESPASLLWGTEHNMAEGDPRLGMFDSNDTSGVTKVLDRQALKNLGLLSPKASPAEELHDSKQNEPAAFADDNLSEPVQSMTPGTVSTPVESKTDALRRSSRGWTPSNQALQNLANGNSQATFCLSGDPMLESNLLQTEEFLSLSQSPLEQTPCSKDPTTMLLALTESQLLTITPKSAELALQSSSRVQWLDAMNREKQCHVKNGTFGEEWSQEGPCPKPIPAGWVFKIKHRGTPIEERPASQTIQSSCRHPRSVHEERT